MSNPLISFDKFVSDFTNIVLAEIALTQQVTHMSLISKIEEEFTLLRQFLVSTLGDHIHIPSGGDDALERVKGLLVEAGHIHAEPVASEGASGGTAEPSAPASEESPTSTQSTNSEEK